MPHFFDHANSLINSKYLLIRKKTHLSMWPRRLLTAQQILILSAHRAIFRNVRFPCIRDVRYFYYVYPYSKRVWRHARTTQNVYTSMYAYGGKCAFVYSYVYDDKWTLEVYMDAQFLWPYINSHTISRFFVFKSRIYSIKLSRNAPCHTYMLDDCFYYRYCNWIEMWFGGLIRKSVGYWERFMCC